jgi:hypothetical protein
MAVTFPANPVNGQEYTVNNITYVYNSASDYWRDLGRAASTGGGSSTGGVTVYALAEDLPVINVAEGAMALVQETGKLFVYNSGWYNIAMVNTVPTVTGINSSYDLAQDGTATVITVTGTDSENVPLTYTYSATGLGTIATISQSGNQFTITPSTSADDAGTFSVTFTVTDGVNAVDTVSSFTLSFATQITDTKYNVALITSSGTVGTSTDITDNSSSSHNITVGGDAHLTSLTPYRGGGYSTYFDGTGDYLSVADDTSLNVLGSSFTVECWFYLSEAQSNVGLISKHDGADGYLLRLDTTFIRWYTSLGSIDVPYSFNKGQWYHVAVVSDSTTGTMYIDGVAVSNTFSTNGTNATSPLQIGRTNTVTNDFSGYIKDVRITNTAVYTANFTPPTEPIEVISNTALLTCHRGWLGDASSNRHSITVNGNANTQPFGPYDSVEYNATNQGGSIYTGGTTGDRVQVASSTDFAFGTGDFTIEGWFDLPSIGTNDYLFDIGTNGLYVRFVSGVLTYFNGTNNQTTGTTSSLLPVNSWNHIALVRNSGSTTMYINGKSVPGITGITDTVDWTNSATVTLMDYGAGSAGVETRGFVSDFRITKGSAVYTADFLPTDVVVSNTAETVLHIKAGNADIVDKTQSVQLTLNGNTTTSNAVTKYENSSIYFDGSADNITFPVSAYGTGDFTVEAWAYPLASSNRFSQVFYVTDDMSVQYNHEDHPGVFRILYGGTAVTSSAASTDQWYHIAVVRSGTTVTLYIDGTSVGTHTYASDVPTFQQYLGGNYTISADLAWKGYMEDFRITKGLARYTAAFTPPAQSLQA